MSNQKGHGTQDNSVSHIPLHKKMDYTGIEGIGSKPLEGIIESDQAVEPDAKVAQEVLKLKGLPESEENSKTENNITTTAHAAAKIRLSASSSSKKMKQKKRANERNCHSN